MGSKAVCPIKRDILKKIKSGKIVAKCKFAPFCHRKDKGECEFKK